MEEMRVRSGSDHVVRNERNVDAQSTSTVHTEPLWPSYVPSRSPLCVNQTFMMESFDAEKRRSPSRLSLIWVSERSWPTHRDRDHGPVGKARHTDPGEESASTQIQ
jgi:hypothetical protein